MASIVEMPELVLEKVIGFSDFKAVLSLRQVCRDFRNFIDDLNDSKLPDSKFQEVKITSGDKRIEFELVDSDNFSNRILFSKAERSRRFYGNTEVFENSNIMDVAVRDLEMILKFQKTILKQLRFEISSSCQHYNDSSVNALPIKLSNMFKKLNRKIKTKVLIILADYPSEVMSIFDFVDPDTLKTLGFTLWGGYLETEIDEFVKTEHWKKADGMSSDFIVLNLNVEDICHFSSCSIRTNSITAQELDFLRKTYTSSSNYKNSSIHLRSFNEIEELGNLWDPTAFFDSESSWLFRMKNSDERILHIEIHEDHSAHSTRKIVDFVEIPSSWVSPEAIIHDYNGN
ncbi:unnamed protein product [Caenorhabditis nigoni]